MRSPFNLGFRALVACIFLAITTSGAEVIPPKPARYFNDYAGVVSKPTAERLNQQLETLEKSDGSQILVATFPKRQSESSLEDYTVRVAEAWGVGQKKEDNGAVLFLFVQDREIRIEVGYGLEGRIPDAIAKDIIETQITPALRAGNFDQGLTAGVQSLIQAAHGEYRGTGRTLNQAQNRSRGNGGFVTLVIIILVVAAMSSRQRRGKVYGGRRRGGWGGPFYGGWGGGGGWGSGGGGGWSGGGGGGFTGGGGSFGGGGASGRW